MFDSSLRPGRKALEGRNASRESRFRSRWKRDGPHGRQAGATSHHGRRGENRRGGVKPRGRNETGAWHRRSEEVAWRHGTSGVDSSVEYGGGALWKTPGEEARRFGVERLEPERVEKGGAKGQEGRRTGHFTMVGLPCESVLEGPCDAARAGRSTRRRRAVRRPTTHDDSQVRPPQATPSPTRTRGANRADAAERPAGWSTDEQRVMA